MDHDVIQTICSTLVAVSSLLSAIIPAVRNGGNAPVATTSNQIKTDVKFRLLLMFICHVQTLGFLLFVCIANISNKWLIFVATAAYLGSGIFFLLRIN